jgi:hypothetical protein
MADAVTHSRALSRAQQNQGWQPMPLDVALGSHATGDARTLELE